MAVTTEFHVGSIVLAAAAVTDVGLKRKHNEDAVRSLEIVLASEVSRREMRAVDL